MIAYHKDKNEWLIVADCWLLLFMIKNIINDQQSLTINN
jgi:hypothetical protein